MSIYPQQAQKPIRTPLQTELSSLHDSRKRFLYRQKKSIASLTFTAAAFLALIGCSQYRVSLNDTPVTHPFKLFNNYETSDAALRQCLDRTIFDQRVQNASTLTLVNCSAAGVSSLAGIQVFTQLSYLNFDNNRISSLAPLLQLEHLKTLNINNNVNINCQEVAALIDRGVKVHTKICPPPS